MMKWLEIFPSRKSGHILFFFPAPRIEFFPSFAAGFCFLTLQEPGVAPLYVVPDVPRELVSHLLSPFSSTSTDISYEWPHGKYVLVPPRKQLEGGRRGIAGKSVREGSGILGQHNEVKFRRSS